MVGIHNSSLINDIVYKILFNILVNLLYKNVFYLTELVHYRLGTMKEFLFYKLVPYQLSVTQDSRRRHG